MKASTKETSTGTYKVINAGNAWFAAFVYNDGEVFFLSRSYRTEAGATKRLQSHINCL